MTNTIILLKGIKRLTNQEFKNFEKGNTIYGDCSNPQELKRWSIDQKLEAKEELKKYRCSYIEGNVVDIEEYALVYCDYDPAGEFINGSDFDLAAEA